jgi:hypothetical protein
MTLESVCPDDHKSTYKLRMPRKFHAPFSHKQDPEEPSLTRSVNKIVILIRGLFMQAQDMRKRHCLTEVYPRTILPIEAEIAAEDEEGCVYC